MPADLIQIVDAAMAEAARKAGSWLACKPGCMQCCLGPFPITELDALRLQHGLAELALADPARAGRVRTRTRGYLQRLPFDTAAGVLASEAFMDEPCPALDPDSGLCDLYSARPILCRTFGPPIQFGEEAVNICELCFVGATDAEVAQCKVRLDPEVLGSFDDAPTETLVAFALAAQP